MKRVCFFSSGGPATTRAPGQQTGTSAKSSLLRPCHLERSGAKSKDQFCAAERQTELILRQAQDDGSFKGRLLQRSQVVRATRKFCAYVFLFSFLFSVAHAQTNSTDTATNAPTVTAPTATTNAPSFDPMSAPSQPVNVLNGAGNQPPAEDIADIRPPFFFDHGWLWLWIALGIAGLAALIFLLWNWFKPTKALNPRTAYDLALEKLEKARALLREENPMPYAVLVSETIRGYLGQRFQTPSTRRTTEEFLREMETDQATPLAEHRDLLRHFLQSCDLVKFARYQPTTNELEDVHQRAVNFVTATKPAPAPSHRNGRLP
jgi:hypothetical protein